MKIYTNLLGKILLGRLKISRPRRRIKSTRPSRRTNYLAHKDRAKTLVESKLTEFNRVYNFTYNRISIKNQKTRWGSCSSKGNLNFSYKIALLPDNLVNYLIVHELCHLGEFNHSVKFWNLVAQTIPDYKKLRKELSNFQINPSVK